ncbi:AAA domain containing protein [uncultured Caudovirales phage]|uniref:AAA domain containing protein n=1 Tax=uncultured Caudovirales phage TaxID=2100421 RepID=A0A6J5P3U8_9CAUD|nr:AAA domain containing protein [uncultured Caudovirales phage]
MDTWDWPGTGNDAAKVVPLPLRATPARLPEPRLIRPREWLYGTTLIRRFVSVLVAPGGTGKSTYAIGRGMALASGRPILGDTVHHSVRSWVMNLEDPLEELERRVAAMMMRHQVTREELEGRLFLHSGRDRRLLIAQPTDYGEIVYPDKEAIVAAMRDADIGHLVVDPVVKSHGLEENSNPHMDAVATAWAEVGEATGAAIDLIHHTRKGATMDVDAARGAKALTDASRVTQTMASMTPEEAEKLGVPDEERWQYVRLDDGKSNMAPRATDARWFILEPQTLGNGTPEYPHGDKVASIAGWEPPSPFAGITWRMMIAILDRLERGPSEGEMWILTRRGRANERWAGNVFIGICDKTEAQRAAILDQWHKSGLIEEGSYYSKQARRESPGVIVNRDKWDEISNQNLGGGQS